ncbi:MAG: hypothetical protein WB760_02380 [Xanthobacteraceae bacterium]
MALGKRNDDFCYQGDAIVGNGVRPHLAATPIEAQIGMIGALYAGLNNTHYKISPPKSPQQSPHNIVDILAAQACNNFRALPPVGNDDSK